MNELAARICAEKNIGWRGSNRCELKGSCGYCKEKANAIADFWGPTIYVNGKRPFWLSGIVLCNLMTSGQWRCPEKREPSEFPAENWHWTLLDGEPNITAIRLPKDHPVYSEPFWYEFDGTIPKLSKNYEIRLKDGTTRTVSGEKHFWSNVTHYRD